MTAEKRLAQQRLSYLVHDLLDTKSRVVLRRRASLAHSSAEREVALEMLDDFQEAAPALGLPHAVEIASADAGYRTGAFAADLLDREVLPHMPLQAGSRTEEIPTWKRRTSDLDRQRQRREKVRRAQARNRVRELQQSRGYQVSRKLRIRSEHCFAEAKTLHGMDRARVRGLARVQVQADLVGTAQSLKRLVAFRGRPQGRAARLGLSAPAAHSLRSCRSAPGRLFRPASPRRSGRLIRPRPHRPLPGPR